MHVHLSGGSGSSSSTAADAIDTIDTAIDRLRSILILHYIQQYQHVYAHWANKRRRLG